MSPRSPPQPDGVESSPPLWELWLESWAWVLTLWLMVFESFAHVPVTEELLQHVWEGEANGHQGGHRFGLGREGKTEFPEDWTIELVETALLLTLRSPQAVKFQGAYIYCQRQVGEVIVALTLEVRETGLRLDRAFPVCGVGVFRNDRGLKTQLPLDLSVLET